MKTSGRPAPPMNPVQGVPPVPLGGSHGSLEWVQLVVMPSVNDPRTVGVPPHPQLESGVTAVNVHAIGCGRSRKLLHVSALKVALSVVATVRGAHFAVQLHQTVPTFCRDGLHDFQGKLRH